MNGKKHFILVKGKGWSFSYCVIFLFFGKKEDDKVGEILIARELDVPKPSLHLYIVDEYVHEGNNKHY